MDPTLRHGAAQRSGGTAPLLDAALAYARAGWPVHPLRPDDPSCPADTRCQCKAPLTRAGFKDASTNLRQVADWWAAWPDANIGLATGWPGCDVFDVDVKNGDGMPAFRRVKAAGLLSGALAVVQTPSGGLHVYFKGTDHPCRALPKHHVECKRRGGYVLAPPSRVHGKPYVLLDHRAGAGGRLDWDAITRLLAPPRPPQRHRPASGDMSGLADWVSRLEKGNRNSGLFWAACRVAEQGADPLALLTPALLAGLPETEALRTIESARKAANP